jgi:hypothetical protein
MRRLTFRLAGGFFQTTSVRTDRHVVRAGYFVPRVGTRKKEIVTADLAVAVNWRIRMWEALGLLCNIGVLVYFGTDG